MNLKRAAARLLLMVMLLTLPLESLAATGKVNTSSLKLRQKASTSAKVLQTLDKGDALDVISATGDWYKVKYGKYTGYVMKKYVKVSGKVPASSTSNNTNTSTSGIDSINDIKNPPTKTLRPGDRGDNVKKLQQALTLLGHYSGKIDGDYGSGTTAAVKAFQKKKGLSQDGVAGPKTLSAIFGTNTSSSYVTERLDWFKNGSSTIPKGAVVTVKDCKTGKTFQAKRWSGSNHADMEPLTKEDAATMKVIYGGKWSWDRRAILVKYNGHVYAASMNGMPHGTDTISNNNFDGHFCIHFYGSKTHESKKVDPDHKAAEAKAMNYTW